MTALEHLTPKKELRFSLPERWVLLEGDLPDFRNSRRLFHWRQVDLPAWVSFLESWTTRWKQRHDPIPIAERYPVFPAVKKGRRR
jgi:hypothetical protein